MRQVRNTSRESVTRRRPATSSSQRVFATASNRLPSCKLRLCSSMPDLDNATLHNWLHHWQDEFDAAYLYLVLAGQEPDQKKKEIYVKLAGVEERHTQLWEKLLAEHGHPVETGRARPSLNARVRAWFGRQFGPGYLLPLLLREEGQEVKGYMDLHEQSRLADALSMGASGYLAAKSELEVYAHEIAMEQEEIRLMPEVEQDELALVYQAKGIEAGIARQMAAEVMRDPKRALGEQVREELKIGEAHATPFKEGWVTGVSTAVGALIPVAPFVVLSGPTAAWTAFAVAMLSHFAVGGARSFFTGRGVIRSGIDMFVVGLGVAAVGYFVGNLVAGTL